MQCQCGGDTHSYSRHPPDGQNQDQQINIFVYFHFEHNPQTTEVSTLQVTECNALFSFDKCIVINYETKVNNILITDYPSQFTVYKL